MSLIKGIPDVEMLDFSKMSDEQLMEIRINIDLTSIEETNVFLKELKKNSHCIKAEKLPFKPVLLMRFGQLWTPILQPLSPLSSSRYWEPARLRDSLTA